MRLVKWIGPMLAVAAQTVAAQQAVQLKQIFTSESLVAKSAQTSPDGKWVVISASRGSVGASLWIAPTSGGDPHQLTSDGHSDREPTWLPTGDGVVFLSTRPNRNGGLAMYLMTLAIDPSTGQATGVPRQVTSEPARTAGAPSPDGRWLTYATPGSPADIKIVPVNGGAARTLASAGQLFGFPVFSHDGKHVYYTNMVPDEGGACPVSSTCQFSLWRVPVTGDAPEVVVRERHPVVPFRGGQDYTMQLLGLGSPNRRWELRSSAGQPVAGFDVPKDGRVPVGTGDGTGMMVVRNEAEYSTRIVPVAGGPIRVLTAGGYNWAEAWMPDGSAIITDRPVGDRGMAAEVVPLQGGTRKQVLLGTGTKSSGWSTSVGPWFSYQTSNPDALHLVNVTTGQRRTASANTVHMGLEGRGGMEQDGSHIIYAERKGNRVEIRAMDPETGASEVIRGFPNAAPAGDLKVHGRQLAWFAPRADSVDLMLTTGPSGPPRRIATYPASQVGTIPSERLAWSWSGERMAICRSQSGTDRDAVVTVIDLPSPKRETVRTSDFGMSGWIPCWQTQWLPDDSGLLTLSMRSGSQKPDIVYLPLREGAQPTAITREESNEVWNFLTSPDGKSVAYPVNLPVSRSSIYIVDFKPLLKARP